MQEKKMNKCKIACKNDVSEFDKWDGIQRKEKERKRYCF